MKKALFLTLLVTVLFISCYTGPENLEDAEVLVVGNFQIHNGHLNPLPDDFQSFKRIKLKSNIKLTFYNHNTEEFITTRTVNGFFYFIGKSDMKYSLWKYEYMFKSEDENDWPSDSTKLEIPIRRSFTTVRHKTNYIGHIIDFNEIFSSNFSHKYNDHLQYNQDDIADYLSSKFPESVNKDRAIKDIKYLER